VFSPGGFGGFSGAQDGVHKSWPSLALTAPSKAAIGFFEKDGSKKKKVIRINERPLRLLRTRKRLGRAYSNLWPDPVGG